MPHVTSNGAKIWWESAGDGDPIVLINGLSSPSEAWFRVAPWLAQHLRVITIDNRGVGRSDAPRGRYTVTTMAHDVLNVMDAAQLDWAHVVGISMGSCVAQELALLAPDRVRSLVLAASNPGRKHTAVPRLKPLWLVLTCGLRDYKQFNRKLIPYVYHRSTNRALIEEDMQRARGTAPTRRGLRGQTFGVVGWDRFTRLGELRMPTLVLHGREDLLCPPLNAERLTGAIPGARLVWLANASHQLFTDQQQAALGAIDEFLDTVGEL